MLRQLINLWRYGRIRTKAPTVRRGKPRFLQQQPNLEILNLLQLVVADYGKTDDFFFVQIGAFDGVTADPIYELVRSRNWHGVLAGHGYRFLLEDSDTKAYLGRSQSACGFFG